MLRIPSPPTEKLLEIATPLRLNAVKFNFTFDLKNKFYSTRSGKAKFTDIISKGG